jgi:hypothetical protein
MLKVGCTAVSSAWSRPTTATSRRGLRRQWKQLYEADQVFGLVGNVGTPTAVVALPYALDRKMLFFGAFTGAGLLRNDPPDRYVFNYRASYAEETSAVVNYLVKVRRLLPEQIAVFAQQDAYGDAGFAGVEKAIRSLRGGNESLILRLNYQRNTVDVEDAVAQLQQYNAQLQQKKRFPIKAVIMVPTYRAAAKFIEKTRDSYPDMIYTSVSFVGSTALADELMLLGKVCNWSHRHAGRAGGRWPLVIGPRLQICTRQILSRRGAGLRVSRRLCGRQCVDRRFATKWPTA